MGRIITNEHFLPGQVTRDQLMTNLRPNGGMEDLTYGFLGRNELLDEVIESDRELLARLGFTHEQFAKTIDDIFEYMPASINGNPLHLFGYIHSPVCPWDDFCAVSQFDYSEKVTEIWLCSPRHYWKLKLLLKLWSKEKRLTKLRGLVERNWVMVLSDLHPHLIRDHHFLQGHSTPYRVDPERFVRFLGKRNIYPYEM